MNIRPATVDDIPELKALYEGTIKAVNSRDYDAAQIAAWVSTAENTAGLRARILETHFIVALSEGSIVVFGSIANDYLDLLYVHADYQGQGVARLLVAALLRQARSNNFKEISVHSSITAKPFFVHCGFIVIGPQTKLIRGVELTNFAMKLTL